MVKQGAVLVGPNEAMCFERLCEFVKRDDIVRPQRYQGDSDLEERGEQGHSDDQKWPSEKWVFISVRRRNEGWF
jgi:hypothetical protein